MMHDHEKSDFCQSSGEADESVPTAAEPVAGGGP
jgi:hypothetical protein